MKLFNKLVGLCRRINYKNRIVLMVDGGFCSQLHKYFIGLFLEKHYGANVEYDLTWFKNHGKSIDGKDSRDFCLLDVYPNIRFKIADEKEIRLFKKYFYHTQEEFFEFPPKFLTKKTPPLYIDGYLSHWKYYREIKDIMFDNLDFAPELSKQNLQYLKEIQSCENSVAVHIRRGDYVNSIHDILDENYFINAIFHMKKILNGEVKFFFFSDGFDWVEEKILPNIGTDINFEFVKNNNNNNGYFDFYLITQCKNQISSNSSFGYMGAHLNRHPDKKVIIPKIWMNGMDTKDAFYEPGWIIMDGNEHSVVEALK